MIGPGAATGAGGRGDRPAERGPSPLDPLPPLFTATEGWSTAYRKYDSPWWWARHLAANGPLQLSHAGEVPDGDIRWEDDMQYRSPRAGWSAKYVARSGWLIRQILARQSALSNPTHRLVVATRRPEAASQRRYDTCACSEEQT